ncbi:uncharacterized protein RSE6_14452 [Rhynchosporium secalis]|uniref:Uncharacterized protein n=1 Tax=Rhynchosporium secalis TaxID=38038 RepID=A0A1E1MVB8_RHYSE|nr:uncharacterized protein RSE6_14452 [Rhynchosporium secalis]
MAIEPTTMASESYNFQSIPVRYSTSLKYRRCRAVYGLLDGDSPEHREQYPVTSPSFPGPVQIYKVV